MQIPRLGVGCMIAAARSRLLGPTARASDPAGESIARQTDLRKVQFRAPRPEEMRSPPLQRCKLRKIARLVEFGSNARISKPGLPH